MFMPPMILRREMTVLCNSEGTVSTRRKRPSIRIRTTISPSCGSKWISLARSENARSMRLLTKRIVGASMSCCSVIKPALYIRKNALLL